MNLAVSDTVLPLDDAWDRRIGTIWAQILHLHAVDPVGDIAEVGPGFALKIGLGLKEYGFRGSLYVVEPNDRVNEWIIPRYRELLPSAHVIPVPSRLRSAASGLPTQLDALLMNHLLDDLVLDAVTPEGQRGAIFGKMHRGSPCRADVRRAWQRLAVDPVKLAAASQTVIDDICFLCLRTHPKLIGISQYPSWSQVQGGLEVVDEMAAPLLRQLKRHLPQAITGAHPRLLRFGEKEPRWLVLLNEEMNCHYAD
jgi:hypothetical protein